MVTVSEFPFDVRSWQPDGDDPGSDSWQTWILVPLLAQCLKSKIIELGMLGQKNCSVLLECDFDIAISAGDRARIQLGRLGRGTSDVGRGQEEATAWKKASFEPAIRSCKMCAYLGHCSFGNSFVSEPNQFVRFLSPSSVDQPAVGC